MFDFAIHSLERTFKYQHWVKDTPTTIENLTSLISTEKIT